MQLKLLASAALFPILSLAQIQGVDQNLVSKISADAAAITANPTWIAAVNAVASAAPSSVLAAAGNNPTILFNQIASATTPPSWYSNVPTSVVGPFASLVAPAIKANADFNAYISSAAAQPAGSALLNAVYSAAPPIVQSSFYNNKLGLVASVVVSTASWASNIPLPVQTSIANVYNSALRIEASDLEITRTASRTGTGRVPYGTGKPSISLLPFGTGRPSNFPTYSSCTAVTVTTTVTASPFSKPSSGCSSFSKPTSVASAGFSTPTFLASTGFPKPPPTPPTTGLPPVSTTTASNTSKTTSSSVVAFTGAAAPRMGKGGVGVMAVVVAGVGGLLVG
ncbi:hypothetical protein JMJ35_004954 [Cladonia borealis]|uniref:Uncharacterized protein n=1 Tax=Cladonia borealis TaxID=184061 RepID=A0AA39V269_9LECA|nr:hypothetical protein JMJ35_004954 [Cladonia borealis]